METTKTTLTSDNHNQIEMQSEASTTTSTEKRVTKRNGELEVLSRDKLKKRLEVLLEGLNTEHLNVEAIVNKVIAYSQNGKANNY